MGLTTESAIQAKFHKEIWNRFPLTRYLCYHIPNEAKRTGHAFMVAMGMIPGIPDYKCDFPSGEYIGLFLEFKKPDGALSDNQKKAHAALRAQGHRVEVVYSFDQALEIFIDYAKNTKYLQNTRV